MPWNTCQIHGMTEYQYTIPDDNFKLTLKPGYTAELKLRMPEGWLLLDSWHMASMLGVETAQNIAVEHAETVLDNMRKSFAYYLHCIKSERRKKRK